MVLMVFGLSGSSSILRRSRAMRMSIERSNGSHSRLRVSVRSWSRDSTRFGCSAKARSRSNSMRGERDVLAAATDELVLVEIEHGSCRRGRAAEAAARLCRRLAAAQHALHPREQLAQVERLADVVVGADLEADHAVDHLAGRRDHDDGDVVALAQPAREREPVLARQAHVEQHQARASRLRAPVRIAAPSRRLRCTS